MKFIFNERVYDTEKSEMVVEYKTKRVATSSWFPDMNYVFWDNTILYKTKNNNWFEVVRYDKDSGKFVAINEKRAAAILSEINQVEIYEKYFGKLEEA